MSIVKLTTVSRMHKLIPLTYIVPLTTVITLSNVIVRYFPLQDLDAACQAAKEPDPPPLPRWEPEDEPDTFSLPPEVTTWQSQSRYWLLLYLGSRDEAHASSYRLTSANQQAYTQTEWEIPARSTRANPNEERPPPGILLPMLLA